MGVATSAAVPLIEFRIADRNAVYWGVSPDALMGGAGREVAKFVASRFKRGHPRVVVLAGKGNNGGDGFAAASVLARHFHVTVVLAEGRAAVDPEGPAGRALKAMETNGAIVKLEWSAPTKARVKAALQRADVVLDCLLGSGISGAPRAPYHELIALCSGVKGLVVSVDVPSGFPFEPAVRPRVTLTIEAPKTGMTRKNSGDIRPIHIGFPPEAWTHTGPGDLLLIPRVSDYAHKGERGVLGVVAGGPYSGAPALVALAAHACGVGLVHVFAPESVADVVRRFDPTLIVHPLPGSKLETGHAEEVLAGLEDRGCGAMAIGPGLGRARGTLEASRSLISGTRLPTVVDADAIFAAASFKGAELQRAVLTPHDGEFKAFAGRSPGAPDDIEARTRASKEIASARHTSILLKGHTTVVTDGKRVKLNDAGVSAMAVGGTGDVLTGITGAMLAKGLSPFDAARVGAFVSGKAGELAFESLGHSLKPTDMIGCIPRVLARYVEWWGGRP